MDAARIRIEEAVLAEHFPRRYVFHPPTHGRSGYLEVTLKSSRGRHYRLKVMLAADYPARVPEVYLVYPETLPDHRKRNLASLSPSHKMHLLKPMGNFVQLCHYKPENWHPNVTLYKVALKCLLWIEAYEDHLRSGQPIVDYLGK